MSKKKNFIPGWTPVYVTGRNGFMDKLNEALLQSRLPFMPGYYYDSSVKTDHSLIWIDSGTPLQEYKKAIGARNLWKYRIRFFSTLADFTAFVSRLPADAEALEPAA